jgi:hypothetical protein
VAESGDNRAGTATSLSGSAAFTAASGTKAASGSVLSLAGSGTLGSPVGSRAGSGVCDALSGSGSLSDASGSKAVSGPADAISGSGVLGDADGFAFDPFKDRSGTCETLSGAGSYTGQTGIAREVTQLRGRIEIIEIPGKGKFPFETDDTDGQFDVELDWWLA